MEILNLRPPFKPQDQANFDLQVGPHLRLYNLAIRRLPNGYFRIMAPNAFGKHSATFAPAMAAEITEAVLAAMGGKQANDRSEAA
ncbi:Hypothetical protein NGAL_HAMBI2605_09640 [Neorhizobium galegae bv. orientalis]|nr:Hypothetical protein NGAL_HAMBI2605_09640 [Neorhizobium galegae bv. orientalis]